MTILEALQFALFTRRFRAVDGSPCSEVFPRSVAGRLQTVSITFLLAALAMPCQAESARQAFPLDQTWRFHLGDAPSAAQEAFDDSDWTEVRLPHTWNGADGEDGGDHYYRGPGWYRVTFQRPNNADRLWLEFDGAALVTQAWVNGAPVGRHEGGYARFRFDITDAVREEENILAVRVDNAPAPHIAPLGGDFTVFGGLYRAARLVAVDSLHVDLADYGGPGVYMTARNVTKQAADLSFVTRLANDTSQSQRVNVRVTLANASGETVATADASLTLAAGARGETTLQARLRNPRLWRGRTDPHLYHLTAEVIDSRGQVRDRVKVRTGVRSIQFDSEDGFELNGEKYSLHGVNYQLGGRPGRGVAARDFEINEDFEIMNEMGATAIRFAHMQHDQRAYELANELGLAVWTEAPLVAKAADDPAFSENLAQQMRELIRQNRNHPSVIVWGIGNEVYAADETAQAAIALMQKVAKEEDPSRPTVYAHCCQDDLHRIALTADLGAYNRYYGWYENELAHIADWADELHARAPDRPFAVSEYGAGASILHQQTPPERPRPDGGWHPEQYQTRFHEVYWRALRDRPFIWGKFIWVAFDFASDGRNEGDRPGINDKGLVTYDRAVRKDAYYWYQANWSDAPMAHIRDRRMATRYDDKAAIRVYSNLKKLTLAVNHETVSTIRVIDHEAQWTDVPLAPGLNRIEIRDGSNILDVVYWQRLNQ